MCLLDDCIAIFFFFFFFQAEDGIRDADVTGVQTCALPICFSEASRFFAAPGVPFKSLTDYLEHERSLSEFLEDFPSVTRADRKSTRLNSSHVRISYAVFCLKKKKNPDACQADSLTPQCVAR